MDEEGELEVAVDAGRARGRPPCCDLSKGEAGFGLDFIGSLIRYRGMRTLRRKMWNVVDDGGLSGVTLALA